MSKMSRILLAVLCMALVSYLPRVLPLAVRKKIQSPFLRSFLYYVPFAALGALTFPHILYSTGHLVSATVGMVVAFALAFRGKGLLTVAVAAAIAVYLCQLFLV
jgi:branched-subunit amino acid transport protein